VTIEPILTKGMRVPSTVMTGIEGEGDTKAKYKESRDMM